MDYQRSSSLPRHPYFAENTAHDVIDGNGMKKRGKTNHMYPDLSKYLSNLEGNVRKLLKNPSIWRILQSHHPQVIEFLCQNMNSLILTALDQNDYKISTTAFLILISDESEIRETLLDGMYLKQSAVKALHRNDKRFSLKRMIQIIENSIIYRINEFPMSLSFICMFIPFISEPCIFYFFKSICSNDDKYIPSQNWLIESNFPMIVAEELAATLGKGDETTDIEVLHTCYLLQTISNGRKCLRLCEYFITHRIIEILNIDWKGLKEEVLDDFWEAILSVYTKQSAPLLRGLFQKAIDLIILPYEVINRYRLYVIDLISLMLTNDPIVSPYIIETHLELSVLRLLHQFPGHSFLQKSLLQLCEIAFQIPQMQCDFVDAVISPLIYEGAEIRSHFLRAFGCAIVEKAYENALNSRVLMAKLRAVENFDKFMEVTLKNRKKLLKNGYGGRVPRFKIREIVYEE